MCGTHDHASFSRRGVFSLVSGGAALTLLHGAAHAAGDVQALAVTCIDYRLVDDGVKFFDGLGMTNRYDQVALAGASLAAISASFPSSNAAFWDHVAIAKKLHNIREVIALDHRDCGAYKVAFGKNYAAGKDGETAQHKDVMGKLQAMLKKRHPDLGSSFYLMALDGTAEKVI
jgi:hypothetical protein